MPLLTLLLTFATGWLITLGARRFAPSPGMRIFYAFPLGVAALTILHFVGMKAGLRYATGITLAQLLLLAACVWPRHLRALARSLREDLRALGADRSAALAMAAALVPLSTAIVALFARNILPESQGSLLVGGGVFGDLPFHMGIISQLAYTERFPPLNPVFSAQPLVYPYFTDLYDSVLAHDGWSLRAAIAVPGALLAISLAGIVHDFSRQFLGRAWRATLATLLFFLAGGVGFVHFTASPLRDLTHDGQLGLQWSGFLTNLVVPELSFALGLGTGIFALQLLLFPGVPRVRNWTRGDQLLIALLFGFMPLIHTHTVLAFLILLPWLVARGALRIRELIPIAVLTLLFGALSLPSFLGHLQGSGGFFRWQWGWLKGDQTFVGFWLRNSLLLLPVAAIALLPRAGATRLLRSFVAGAFLLFAAVNLFSFQPFAWDNIKLLVWASLFFAIAFAHVFSQIWAQVLARAADWRPALIARALLGVIAVAQMLSSTLTLARMLVVQHHGFGPAEIAVANWLRTHTPTDALVLTPAFHLNPVNALAGRKVLMGYPGALWVHGIAYGDVERDLKAMLSGAPDSGTLMIRYGAEYAVFSVDDPAVNAAHFARYPTLFEQGPWRVTELMAK